MARGFESKDVEFQQEEAGRRETTADRLTPEKASAVERQRRLELSLAATRAERRLATHRAHQDMLDRAITMLEEELRTKR